MAIEQTFTLAGQTVQLETEHFNAKGNLGTLAYQTSLLTNSLPEAEYNLYGEAVVGGNAFEQLYYQLEWALLVPDAVAFQLDALVQLAESRRVQKLDFAIQLVDTRARIGQAIPRTRATSSLATIETHASGTVEEYSPIWSIKITDYSNTYYFEGYRQISMSAQELQLVDPAGDLA